MASRMRTTAPNLYDAFYIFEHNTDACGTSKVDLIKKYPSDIDDTNSLGPIKKFCFPKSNTNWDSSDPVAFFTFTLTDGQGLFTFGHCRFSPSKRTCMCILSALPDIAFFKYTLGYISIAQPIQVDKCLQYLYHTQMPTDEQPVKFSDLAFSSSVRDFNKYFSSFNEMEVILLFNSLQYSSIHIISLYASMLKERRIVITATRLDTLTNCTYGALKLLYPFQWQSIFVPILPSDLIDQLMAPMPYIIGVPKETLKDAGELSQYGEMVVLDIDEQVFLSDTDDSLPAPIFKYLSKQLKIKDNAPVMSPDVLIRTFMKATIIIFGRYRSGLCKADSQQNAKITWDKQRFIEAQPPDFRAFAQMLVCEEGVQYFERFIDEKLEALNNGIGSNEEFDRMLRNVDDYYQEALDASRNFKDSIQGVVSGVKNNANAVIVSFKDTVQQTLKKKSKIKMRKMKGVPKAPYSFAPPTLPSPEKQPTSLIPLKRPSSPDVHLMHFDNNEDSFVRSFLTDSRPASSFSQQASSSNSDLMSVNSNNSSTNPFLKMINDLPTTTNPFIKPIESSTNVVTPSRELWEKFE